MENVSQTHITKSIVVSADFCLNIDESFSEFHLRNRTLDYPVIRYRAASNNWYFRRCLSIDEIINFHINKKFVNRKFKISQNVRSSSHYPYYKYFWSYALIRNSQQKKLSDIIIKAVDLWSFCEKEISNRLHFRSLLTTGPPYKWHKIHDKPFYTNRFVPSHRASHNNLPRWLGVLCGVRLFLPLSPMVVIGCCFFCIFFYCSYTFIAGKTAEN